MRFPQYAGEVSLTPEEMAMFRKDTNWTEGPRIFMEFRPTKDMIEFTLYYRSEKMMYRCDYELCATDWVAVEEFLGADAAYNALLFLVLKNQARLDAEWTDSRHQALFGPPLTPPGD